MCEVVRLCGLYSQKSSVKLTLYRKPTYVRAMTFDNVRQGVCGCYGSVGEARRCCQTDAHVGTSKVAVHVLLSHSPIVCSLAITGEPKP